jgi:hypothetical protein
MTPEHMDPVIQAVRLYIVVVGIAVAVVGSLQIRRWRTFLPENQLGWLAVAAFNFSAVYGTVDVLAKSVPGGSRTYIAAVAATFALCAVMHHPLHRLRRWRRARQLIRRHTKESP